LQRHWRALTSPSKLPARKKPGTSVTWCRATISHRVLQATHREVGTEVRVIARARKIMAVTLADSKGPVL